ncbi:DUF4407 domain-containing protein [Modestobacter sp. I12A-02628]|uniref:DUF4407 domain-containing protein n=1 Tax=Goekera deserti TaxID=2497753 RepID=A0A7K3WCF1_9ACTN|nr:DUF4407 domain-containing protein [Goekera deserti]MPQ98573.1 DUF4407 domain-containing protein [Goekera deserti]NDI49057.1 DUF4407 domain-containing protein [Goekera deserti]NEL54152.1 DUF4407 domain-containing protein [Goekera deserti]
MAGRIRPMLWASGVDVDAAEQHRETRRYATFGALICLMTLWSAGAMFTTARFTLGLALPLALAAAAVFGGVMFSIDRLISQMTIEKDTLRYRVGHVLLVRGLLSVVIGMVVAHSSLTFLYAADIRHLVAVDAAAAASREVALVAQSAPETERIAALEAEVARLDAEVAAAYARTDELKAAWVADAIPVNGTNRAANGNYAGPGDVADPLRREWETYRDVALPAVLAARDTALPGLQAQLAEQRQALGQRQDAAHDAATTTGLSAESRAFLQLLGDDPTVWLWLLFFVVLDLVVAGLKAFWPASEVDKAKRAVIAETAAQAEFNRTDTAMAAAYAHRARRAAEVYMALTDADASREIAAAVAREQQGTTAAARLGGRQPETRELRPRRGSRLPSRG